MYEQGSYSLLQRKLMIGYRRVGAIIDQLEAAGIIGPFGYSVKRKIMFHDIDSLEIFFSTSLKLKLLLTTIHPYVSKQKVKIACFKNIIEILIIDEEYRIAYISAIENIISADELYKDFFNLLTRLYFWHETDTTNTDRIWPFQNVRLSQIGAKNLIKLLEKKSIPDSANHTVD